MIESRLPAQFRSLARHFLDAEGAYIQPPQNPNGPSWRQLDAMLQSKTQVHRTEAIGKADTWYPRIQIRLGQTPPPVRIVLVPDIIIPFSDGIGLVRLSGIDLSAESTASGMKTGLTIGAYLDFACAVGTATDPLWEGLSDSRVRELRATSRMLRLPRHMNLLQLATGDAWPDEPTLF
jgi:hypothetical protein